MGISLNDNHLVYRFHFYHVILGCTCAYHTVFFYVWFVRRAFYSRCGFCNKVIAQGSMSANCSIPVKFEHVCMTVILFIVK